MDDNKLEQQLLASLAREKVYVEALNYCHLYFPADSIVNAALKHSDDDSLLKGLINKVRMATRRDCAKICYAADKSTHPSDLGNILWNMDDEG